jgi:hypothetical protein
MVSGGGKLPVAAAVAAGLARGKHHRFSWRDVEQLKTAPTVIFSAACSTGVSHLAGIGERLGLMAGLRRAGTRSLVAPHWDIVPDIVLPILDDALERYWNSGGLAQSVRAACQNAPAETPTWLKWAIATEGDWR